MKTIFHKTAADAALKVALEIVELIKAKPTATIAFPTGRTMDAVYYQVSILARERKLDCSQAKAFMVDEYLDLPQDHVNTFFYYLNDKLFRDLNFQTQNIHMIPTQISDLDEFCHQYEEKIKKAGGLDLVILGLGMNGHIAMNEPGSAQDSRTRVVALSGNTLKSNSGMFKNSIEIPKRAVTLGIGTISEAKKCVLLVTGQSKSDIVQKIIEGQMSSFVPASLMRDWKNLEIHLDKDSAQMLKASH